MPSFFPPHLRLPLLSLLVVGACGDGEPGRPTDAADPIDAAPDHDAAPDAEPPLACGPNDNDAILRHVVSRLEVPVDSGSATRLGFDLDGDGTIDNQLGQLYASLGSAGGEPNAIQDATDAAIDRGDVLLLSRLEPCETDCTCLTHLRGADPTPAPCTDPNDLTTCRQHLQGTGAFELGAALENRLQGGLSGGTFAGVAGTLLVPLVLGDTRFEVLLVRARAELTAVDPSGFTGKVGGGIPDATVQGLVIPAAHADVVAQIEADCDGVGPDCGCQPDSSGRTLLDLFDENVDCEVSLPEFRDNSLIQTLFAPDLDSDGDGEDDALSMGVGVTAVAASFP